MRLTDIRLVRLNVPPREATTLERRPSWSEGAEVASPMSRYPQVKGHRGEWLPKWKSAWCQAIAEDGTWGPGPVWPLKASAPVIEHLARHLVGEDCLAIDKQADMMFRLTKPYGSTGLASYAISAIDLALWDLKGKLLGKPVYSLLGGAQKERIYCYCTGNDVDWYRELGFAAFKLACPYGPADGLDGMRKNEAFVAQVRDQVGDECELMLDCWMAFDVEYTLRLAETLRPYRLKWIEECLIPEDLDGHISLRRRLPWQTLATGEHWYTHVPFQWAIRHGVVDILQPDISWCGGITTCLKIASAAEAAGVSVILHCGGNTPYGQHFTYAAPSSPWCEFFVGTPPGVPLGEAWRLPSQGTDDQDKRLAVGGGALEEVSRLPGQAVPSEGWLVPSDAPGFGLQIAEDWLVPL